MNTTDNLSYLRYLKLLFFLFLHFAFTISAQEFIDVTDSLGLKHTYGMDPFAGGISFCDFDQDGWDDLSIATEDGDSLVFYKNLGGSFVKVHFNGVSSTGHVKQILWCDYDNDGDKDLFTAIRNNINILYINIGSLSFTPYLLPSPDPIPTGNSYGASFGDIDVDGDLDLFVCNYADEAPIPNQLWINNGNGTFSDATFLYSLDTITQLTFCSAFLDYNNDLLPDLYTAEDKSGYNRLLKNTGGGVLTDDCNNCGAEIVINAMSVSPGDYDNDGDLDVYVTNTPIGNALLKNNGNGTFTDVAASSGVLFNLFGWAATFFDYDHDTDLDLYVCGSMPTMTMRNILYQNQGNGNFLEPTNAGLLNDSTRSFSHAIGDFDNNGFYDIAVLNILPDSLQLWQCTAGTNNWIKIILTGTVSNRDGIGSWIEVWTQGQKQVQYTTCGSSYLSQHSNSKIFGLLTAAKADSIIIRWPSGVVDKYTDINANQLVTATEGETECLAPSSLTATNLISAGNVNSKASLLWDTVALAINYSLQGGIIGTAAEDFEKLTVAAPLTISNLSEETYVWQLRSNCAFSVSEFSLIDTFTIPYCTAPILLQSEISGDSASWLWDSVSTAIGYVFQAGLNPGTFSYQQIISGGDNTTFHLENIPAGNYKWRLLTGCNISPLRISNYSTTQFFSISENIPKRSDEDLEVFLYPNPVDRFLNIHSENDFDEIEIVNILGEVVFQTDNPIQNAYSIDMRGMDAGIYMLKLTEGDEVTTKKILLN